MEVEEADVVAKKIHENDKSRYFIIKSFSNENIGKSLQSSVWATSFRNEKKFDSAFQSSPYVVLIFSVNGSSRFSGYAIISSRPGQSKIKEKVFFGPDGSPFPGKHFDLIWIRHCEVYFRDCDHIINSLNENKAAKIGRDGQELSLDAGRELCRIIDIRATGGILPQPNQKKNINREINNKFIMDSEEASNLEFSSFKNLDDDMMGPSSDDTSSCNVMLRNLAAALRKTEDGAYDFNENLAAKEPTKKSYQAFVQNLGVDPRSEDSTFTFGNSTSTLQYVKSEKQSIRSLLVRNPALQIFPVDLTDLTFAEYEIAYEKSKKSLFPDREVEDINYPPFNQWLA